MRLLILVFVYFYGFSGNAAYVMQNSISIRFIEKQDIPFLAPLMNQLGYQTTIEGLEERINQFLSHEHYGIAVAMSNDCVVGLIAWSYSHFFMMNKPRIYIDGLVIDKNYRRMGIGKKLIAFVEDFAQQFKPCVIDLISGKNRISDGTFDFYHSLGYENAGPRAKAYFRKEIS